MLKNVNTIYCLQVEDTRQNRISFSDQQFEECDAFPEDIEYIFRLDVSSGEVTHKVGFQLFIIGLKVIQNVPLTQ